MDLISHSLRVFDRVADVGSFTKAAEQTYVSQPAVSKAIKQLEIELGVELFERDRYRGTALTSVGEEILPIVRQIIDLEARLYQTAYLEHGRTVDTVRLATIPFGTSELLPLVLPEYRREYPGVKVELIEGNVEQVSRAILNRQADIGLTMAPYGTLDGMELMHDEMVALLPTGSQEVAVDLFTDAENLVYCNIVRETLAACLPPQQARDILRGTTVQSPEGVVRLVSSGTGTGVMSRYYAASIPNDLVVCRTKPAVILEYGLVALSLDNLAAPARALARAFVNVCAAGI